ncbi:MAG: hypothetical protein Sv326_0788 [Candidatus Fermentimicrarchaeum limneticum]|uniref:Uncharacterized protein n=1 Tax=Fermentimicrarchaeum limneticum TaxID=2795018 RepID=A0A7D6BQL1_FERL1|nr:MAG: hypothetical protein Sv326_0788 [Candidatus Fermentimicrarchaeum limneticum]
MGFLLQRTPIGFSARLAFPPARGYSAPALIPCGFAQYRETCRCFVLRLPHALWVGGDVITGEGFINLLKG